MWRETRPAFRVDPLAAARGEPVVEQALAFAREHFGAATPQPVLIYATATPDEVKAVQRELGVAEAGHLVEHTLASIARGLRELGVRIDQLPITPRVIVEALARQREQQANTLKGMPA